VFDSVLVKLLINVHVNFIEKIKGIATVVSRICYLINGNLKAGALRIRIRGKNTPDCPWCVSRGRHQPNEQMESDMCCFIVKEYDMASHAGSDNEAVCSFIGLKSYIEGPISFK
jgi:hypothetical protein